MHNLGGRHDGIRLPTPPKIPIYGCRMGFSVRAPHHNYRRHMVGLPTIRFIIEATAPIIMVDGPTIKNKIWFFIEGNTSMIMVHMPTLISYGFL